MKIKLLMSFIYFATVISPLAVSADQLAESDIVVCQDQADNYGNGKGDDYISKDCISSFKKMAPILATKKSDSQKMNFFGFRNMILIEKFKNNIWTTETIAGIYTELKMVMALSYDEKNQEIAALLESGDILFFSSKITGNVAPYRILKNKELVGSTELIIDNVNDQIVVYNKKSKQILFFSRLANINGLKGKQKLDVLKSIDTSSLELKDFSIDQEKSELHAVDSIKNQNIIFKLK